MQLYRQFIHCQTIHFEVQSITSTIRHQFFNTYVPGLYINTYVPGLYTDEMIHVQMKLEYNISSYHYFFPDKPSGIFF